MENGDDSHCNQTNMAFTEIHCTAEKTKQNKKNNKA